MFDISSLLPQLSVLKHKVTQSSPSDVGSFDSVLTTKIDDLTADTTPSSIDAMIDTMSTLPEELKKALHALVSGKPIDPATLKQLSQTLAVYSRGLVSILNNTLPGAPSAQAEIDLQIVMFGSFQLIENYGQTSALGDLSQVWKTLDMRTDSYHSLIDGLKEFIKTKTCEFKGHPEMPDSAKKKLTWEMQFQLWEMVSTFGITDRSQPLLETFNTSNQMTSAKVDLKGQKIDSLVDSAFPTFSAE